MPAKPREMTSKQRLFAQGILDGMSKTDAYKKAYDTSRWTSRQITNEAHRASLHPLIMAYIKAERSRLDESALLTRIEKRQILAKTARSIRSKPMEKIKAVEVDNVMTGDNAPQKVEVFGLHELLKLVRSGQ